MEKENNYWMFRVSNKWGYKTNFCFENNLVYCGWNVGLSYKSRDEILRDNPEASKMAIKFTYIKENDIIVMPVSGGIAIGKAKEKKHRRDLDWQDTITVEWLTKFYPRKDLSSAFQSSLKYRGTFLNLNRYKSELRELIDNEFHNLDSRFQNIEEKRKAETIEEIAKHLNSNKNLSFQDREFEYFVMHLLELQYEGLKGQINNQKQEARDGKDLTMSIDFDDFDVNVSFNVQVKQHEGEANKDSLFQISKSDDSDPYTRNVVVTTGRLTPEIREVADKKKKKIILFGPEEIASMIFENFENIDEKYYAKLNMTRTIMPAVDGS